MKIYKKEITLIGGYGGGNIGDDALMWTVVKWLNTEFPELRPLVVVTNKKLVRDILKEFSVDIVDSYESYHVTTQVALYGGGTQFFHFNLSDEGKSSMTWRKAKNFFKDPFIASKSLKSKFVKRTIDSGRNVMLGMGFGPFCEKNSPGYIKFLKTMEKADLICVRDKTSYDLLPQKEKAYLGVDLCYTSYFSSLLPDPVPFKRSKENIAIIIRDWTYDNIKQDEIFSSLNEYIKRNTTKKFTFIFLCESLDSHLQNKFSGYQNTFFQSWNPSKNKIGDFLSYLNEFDLVITSRFHGAIFGGLIKLPFITIVIEPKLQIPGVIYQNKKSFFQPPFQYEDLNHLIQNLKAEDFNFQERNQNLITQGDAMLVHTAKFIRSILSNQ